MKYIKRSIEGLVNKTDETFKCALVTGARQTDKSTMLRNLFPERNYITFDDPFAEEAVLLNPYSFVSLNTPPLILD